MCGRAVRRNRYRHSIDNHRGQRRPVSTHRVVRKYIARNRWRIFGNGNRRFCSRYGHIVDHVNSDNIDGGISKNVRNSVAEAIYIIDDIGSVIGRCAGHRRTQRIGIGSVWIKLKHALRANAVAGQRINKRTGAARDSSAQIARNALIRTVRIAAVGKRCFENRQIQRARGKTRIGQMNGQCCR